MVDLVSEAADFGKYDLVIAPVMYMVKSGVAERLERFVEDGGTFVTTFFSGIADENDLTTLGGYPGELRPLLGVWAEEIDALFPNQSNRIVMTGEFGCLAGEYKCGLLCDIVHAEGARVLATYGDDFYAGRPVVTENCFGEGKAYYIASDPEEPFLDAFLAKLCDDQGIQPALTTPAGVEATERVKDNAVFTFVLNHNAASRFVDLGPAARRELLSGEDLTGTVEVPARGVLILES
jgi:beta-galactosidase